MVGEPRLTIVTPVLDDWDAFQRLVAELNVQLAGQGRDLTLLAVDDGSNSPFQIRDLALPADGPIRRVMIVRLALNVGHQRAIAVGLTEAAAVGTDAILVMDSDGEDRPQDVPALLAEHAAEPGAVIFAQRARRSESLWFRAGAKAYRLLFRVLARQTVDFGNFSLIPIAAARRLSYIPDLWNNLPATVMRSRLPYRLVPTDRGRRYAGRSKMNFVGLVVHGMSAMSVYSDVIFVRLLFAAIAVSAVAVIGILTATAIRFGTNLAVPGWASTVVGVFLVLLFQMIMGIVVASLALLGGRSRRPFVPRTDCGQFVASIETIEVENGVVETVEAAAGFVA
jgi:glycosyltransferase involved in cell wall biosynthesis